MGAAVGAATIVPAVGMLIGAFLFYDAYDQAILGAIVAGTSAVGFVIGGIVQSQQTADAQADCALREGALAAGDCAKATGLFHSPLGWIEGVAVDIVAAFVAIGLGWLLAQLTHRRRADKSSFLDS
jgi:positive regulator of sigma E activity